MQSSSLYPLVATGVMNDLYPVKYSAQLYTIPATTNVPHTIDRLMITQGMGTTLYTE